MSVRYLRDILDRCRAAATVEEFVAHDIAFHLRIVEAVGNPVLSVLLQLLSTLESASAYRPRHRLVFTPRPRG